MDSIHKKQKILNNRKSIHLEIYSEIEVDLYYVILLSVITYFCVLFLSIY